MAYVPSFEHDIFISYCHADNADGRVTQFHADLVAGLRNRLGSRAFHRPDEWVFFDQVALKRGDEFSPKLERAARRSALMIALLSPSYVQAPFCIAETEWFLESKRLARDSIERRLIPLVLTPTDEMSLRQFPQFSRDFLRGDLSDGAGPAAMSQLIADLQAHLRNARLQHGAIFVGQAYPAAENFRGQLIEELRGFRIIPENVIFSQEHSVKQALTEAKLAIHFLGDVDGELRNSTETFMWSLEHCTGKSLLLAPPGRELTDDESQLLEQMHGTGSWSQPRGTVVELAEIIRAEMEVFQMPEPSTPIGLACDRPDLETARQIAHEIHERAKGAFVVETPEFLANPKALPVIEWKKFRTRRQGFLVYWAEGEKTYLDANVGRKLPATNLGNCWYVSLKGRDSDLKRRWMPGDPETLKILDEEDAFRYERLEHFLKQLSDKARR